MFQVKDRIKSFQVQRKIKSSSMAMINSLLAKDVQHAVFCRLGSSEMPVSEVGPPTSKPLVSVSAVPKLNTESDATGPTLSLALCLGIAMLGSLVVILRWEGQIIKNVLKPLIDIIKTSWCSFRLAGQGSESGLERFCLGPCLFNYVPRPRG